MSAALAIVLAGACLQTGQRLRGATLAAPAAWAVVACASMALAEALLLFRGRSDDLTASLVRYASAVGACCPMMALLGAKRPQDRGWQWVVFALWVTLLVPAVQAVAASGSSRLEVHLLWRWMIVGLIILALLNYLPTRYALAACFFAAGQFAVMAPFLWNAPAHLQDLWPDGLGWRMAALFLWLIAGTIVELTGTFKARRLQTIAAENDSLAAYNQRWLAFRDAWGAFWGLRIMNRVNESAELGDWPMRLEWGGFAASDGAPSIEIDASVAAKVQQTMDALLRRFERWDRPSANDYLPDAI